MSSSPCPPNSFARFRIFTCALVVVLCTGDASAEQKSRQSNQQQTGSNGRLLDVPFVPQSEALCGGAAASMVFRYWRDVPSYAEDFSSLVNDSGQGITLGDLTRAIRQRGWRAFSFVGTSSAIRQHVEQGRPVIALIEDRPGRYHYVVVVAWTTDRIVFHDPARGPFRVAQVTQFERVWAVTDHAALLILPEPDLIKQTASNPSAASDTSESAAKNEPPARDFRPATRPHNCVEAVEESVRIARAGDLDSAEMLLSIAERACPASSAAPRELAGIRFIQRRWDDTVAFAERAVERDASDMHAWQLLATARFRRGDLDGALNAWNSRNEPRIDLAKIEGLNRTDYQVVADILNLPPQSLLTGDHLERARRRIGNLPAIQMSRVSYSPGANGRATVEVAVIERPLLPRTWTHVVAGVVQAVTMRDVHLDVASPTGNGELWVGKWRWWPHRPRIAMAVAMPRVGRWTGLWRIDAEWEQETYKVAETLMPSDRRRVAVTFGDWRSGDLRWEVSGALENWSGNRRYFSTGSSIERRFRNDQLAVRLQGAMSPSLGRGNTFGVAGISSAWRSAPNRGTSATVQTGLHMVSTHAPWAVWPVADTGHVRAPLLRAHPLIDQGTIRVSALGRVLAHSTIEIQRDLVSSPFTRVRWAVFVDAAKQARMVSGVAQTTQVDVGAGVRAELPGAPGMLRVDIAHGMRDRNVAVSAAWQPNWPGW